MLVTFPPQKYCIPYKKSILKLQSKLSFVTSFDVSHYILLFRSIYGAQLYSGFAIQNTFMAIVFLSMNKSDVTGPARKECIWVYAINSPMNRLVCVDDP